MIEWFDLGGTLQLDDTLERGRLLAHAARGAGPDGSDARSRRPRRTPSRRSWPSGVDFVLEGLYALKKISRSDERGYQAGEQPCGGRRARRSRRSSDAILQHAGREEEVLQLNW